MVLLIKGNVICIPCLTPIGKDRVKQAEATEAKALNDDIENPQNIDRKKFMSKVQFFINFRNNVPFNTKPTTMATKCIENLTYLDCTMNATASKIYISC